MEALDKRKHANLKLKPLVGYDYASKINFSLLGGSEVAEASKSFPIVFPQKSEKQPMLPMALLSFAKGENYFVGKDGKWKADYIPNHFRRYPFIFAAVPNKDNQFAVMIDAASPQLNEKEGQPLFDKDGEPQEIVNKVKNFLAGFQQDISYTQKVLSLLEEKNVLVPKQFTITKGETKNALRGFRVVDMEKVRQLDDETLAKWVKNGLMGLVYAHVNSMSNLKKVAAAQGAVEKK